MKKTPPNPEGEEAQSKRSFLLQVVRYSHLAVALPAATVLGWLLGVELDRWLRTTWLYIPGFILGIIAGFVELIRVIMNSDLDDKSPLK
jgi:F0F1-type ATP synthase assembly protein I